MWFDDHPPPHIHVEYHGFEALVEVASGNVREGELPRKVANIVREWCMAHQTELLEDSRKISVPLAWFPRLLHASPEQRLQVELSRHGLHWDALDENLSVTGRLAGTPDLTHTPPPKRDAFAAKWVAAIN